MKSVLYVFVLMLSLIIVSCGVDKGNPTGDILTGGSGQLGGSGSGPGKVTSADFGIYNNFINGHFPEQRESLYRLYKKDGSKYVKQEGYANEISWKINLEELGNWIIGPYKERVGDNKKGKFTLTIQKENQKDVIVKLENAFFTSNKNPGDDDTKAYLKFEAQVINPVDIGVFGQDLSFTIKKNENGLELILENDKTYPLEVMATIIASVEEKGEYIETNFNKHPLCKRTAPTAIIEMTDFVQDASKSVEYRTCYWDAYEKSLDAYIMSHKKALEDGDTAGAQKCQGDGFTAVKDALENDKKKCATDYQ